MSPLDIFAVSVLRALVELALLTLLGQGILALLAGRRRATNPIYVFFQILTGPAIRLTRRLAPKAILDRHIPFVAFFLALWLWLLLAYVKHLLCGLHGLAGC